MKYGEFVNSPFRPSMRFGGEVDKGRL